MKKEIPKVELLKKELARENYKSKFRVTLISTVNTLIVVAAFAILVATLWMPVLRIYGNSMAPTLEEGQVVVSIKTSDIETGDLVAFYLGNKMLVKRLIATPGDVVNINDEGTVSVNGEKLYEPYITEKSIGECDLNFPYQIPESRYFVMGDHRTTSIDSRSNLVGCISEEQMVGKIIFCVWPLSEFGPI